MRHSPFRRLKVHQSRIPDQLPRGFKPKAKLDPISLSRLDDILQYFDGDCWSVARLFSLPVSDVFARSLTINIGLIDGFWLALCRPGASPPDRDWLLEFGLDSTSRRLTAEHLGDIPYTGTPPWEADPGDDYQI